MPFIPYYTPAHVTPTGGIQLSSLAAQYPTVASLLEGELLFIGSTLWRGSPDYREKFENELRALIRRLHTTTEQEAA